jgi:uncharacterized protein YaeQ
MALQATAVRFKVALANVDRHVYESLDLRLAKHPSETARYLLCRLLAYCVLYEEGLAFSRAGLATPDEPPIVRRSLDGRLLLQVEIGTPSADRLHKASKAAPRVVIFTQHDPALLVAALRGHKVHRLEAIEAYALAPAFLDDVAAFIGERGAELELTIADQQLYVSLAGKSFSTPPRAGGADRVCGLITRGSFTATHPSAREVMSRAVGARGKHSAQALAASEHCTAASFQSRLRLRAVPPRSEFLAQAVVGRGTPSALPRRAWPWQCSQLVSVTALTLDHRPILFGPSLRRPARHYWRDSFRDQRADVHEDRQIAPALHRRDVRDVADPGSVGHIQLKAPLQQAGC